MSSTREVAECLCVCDYDMHVVAYSNSQSERVFFWSLAEENELKTKVTACDDALMS